MKAKATEKARELVDKLGKEYALICVAEIIEAIPVTIDPVIYMVETTYWYQVKEEIEKLK